MKGPGQEVTTQMGPDSTNSVSLNRTLLEYHEGAKRATVFRIPIALPLAGV